MICISIAMNTTHSDIVSEIAHETARQKHIGGRRRFKKSLHGPMGSV